MSRDTEKSLGGPAIILMGIGAVLDVILFHFMFKYADKENLFMVLLSAALIGVIAIGIAKGLISISRRS
jgi:hypothetical protein